MPAVEQELPNHPDLIRMREPDAEPAGTGKCQECAQVRPLFLLVQVRSWHEEHDCPDCMGHDEEGTFRLTLCPRCYGNAPARVDEDAS